MSQESGVGSWLLIVGFLSVFIVFCLEPENLKGVSGIAFTFFVCRLAVTLLNPFEVLLIAAFSFLRIVCEVIHIEPLQG